MNLRIFFLLAVSALVLSGCTTSEPPRTASGRELKLETIDRGPMRPKTYQYRPVDR